MSDNRLNVRDTIALNGDTLPDDAYDLMESLRHRMETLSQRERVVVFQVLTDFYCPRCGIDQPLGDCQCGKANT